MPRSPINFKSEDERKNFHDILRNAKKNSQGDIELSPLNDRK